MGNRTPFVLPSHKLYPRSVHTHFQGLCIVFGLLIYIAVGCLTEHLCSHLLWLCNSAESDLMKPLFSFTLILYHNLRQKSRFILWAKCTNFTCSLCAGCTKAPGRDPASRGEGYTLSASQATRSAVSRSTLTLTLPPFFLLSRSTLAKRFRNSLNSLAFI